MFSSKEKLVVAHRGASGYHPENTLPAFEAAWRDFGAHAVELDVRLSRDGVPVVIHDENLKRLAGIDEEVDSLTAAELGKIKIGQGDKSAFVPTLRQVCEALDGRCDMNVEIKTMDGGSLYDGIEKLTVETVKSSFGGDALYSSFSSRVLENVRKIEADVKLALIFENFPLEPVFEAASKLRLFSLNANQIFLTSHEFVESVRAAKCRLFAWTACEPSEIAAALGAGADGIISNYPDRVFDEIRKMR